MENNYIHRIKIVWTNLCRFVLALVFIFSGFIKANDPQGTYYKVEDYLQAFGLLDYTPEFLPLFGSILLAVVEFTLGVFLLFGIRRKLTTISLLGFMLFMTPFTLYLAVMNPVSDCGCFGDAIILTNWETFWKNIFFLIAAISVFKWSGLMIRIISKKSQWLVSLYTLLYISAIALYCVSYLPIFDFRPYHIGANIIESMRIPQGEKPSVYESLFVMEKNGERKEFTLENYPDSTWTFIDTKIILKEKGYEPPIHDFSLYSAETGEDITKQILTDKGYTFLLVANRLDKADDGYIDLVNEIYDYSVENGYAFYCLTSSLKEDMEQWRERTGAEYPYCTADDITLKTIIRSNPGLVLMKDATIVNKWSCRSLPDEYDLSDRLDKLSLAQMEPQKLQNKILFVVAWFAIPLFIFTMLDKTLIDRLEKRK